MPLPAPLPAVVTLALAALAAAPAAGYNPAEPDQIVKEHGRYTAAYLSDWSTLRTGDAIARKDVSQYAFETVAGEAARREWRHEDRVHLKDLHLKVNWDAEEPDKAGTTLLLFVDVGEVIIENLAIMQMDGDYRGWDTIRVEGADRVVVRNLYLAGPVHSYHLRLEGCGDVLVENVEVTGVDFLGNGKGRVGGGVWINNGNTGSQGNDGTGVWAEHPRLPGWQVVQNCYFHNGADGEGEVRNHDAVLLHAPGHGILFNNVVEDWLRPSMDSSFDIGFRRAEPEFQDRFFRVERNILNNTTFLKTPAGKTAGPNTLLLANNVFVNVQLGEYHGGGADVHYVHNTHVDDLGRVPDGLKDLSRRGADGFASLWNFSGRTYVANSLFYKPGGHHFMYYANDSASPDKHLGMYPDRNVYALADADVTWLRTAAEGVKYRTLDDWRRGAGKDENSRLVSMSPSVFADYAAGDFRLRENPWPGVADDAYLRHRDPRMRVDRDFVGVRRSEQPVLAPGAFAPSP